MYIIGFKFLDALSIIASMTTNRQFSNVSKIAGGSVARHLLRQCRDPRRHRSSSRTNATARVPAAPPVRSNTTEPRKKWGSFFWSSTRRPPASSTPNGRSLAPRRSLAVASCRAYVPGMTLNEADYSVVVKHRAPPPKSWRWEIYRAGRTSSIAQSSVYFQTMTMASRAGKEALKELLHSQQLRWPLV
jgi:hypothetical protein